MKMITPSCSLGLVGLCVILATSANAKKAKSFVTEEDEAKKGENRRNQNLLPPKFVAEKYGKKVGDSMNLETALKIDKEAQELGERPLNFFKVGDGEEVKLLPEVMSVLDMEHVKRDFVPPPRGSDKTPNAEELQLRDTRWWGRLYLDGWPQTIQYLRAHFGIPPPLGTRRVVLANPIDVCGPLVGPTESYYDEAIVVARRGTCTFSSKAFTAKASAPSIAALILVNNEDGNEHLTGPDAHDLDLSVSMVAQADGELLLSVLERDRSGGHDLTGSMIPIHCTPRTAVEEVARGLGDGFCGAATHLERTLANEPLEGGWLTMDGGFNGTTPEPKFEFMIATFGTKVDTARPVAVAPPLPESIADACEPFREHTIENKAVVVQRGNCNFYRKVKNLADAGAGMVIVANSETRLQRFGVEPRWKGLDIGVPTIMVTDLGGKAILDAVATSTNDTVLKFTLSPSVRERTWNDNVAAASERFVGDVEKDAETLKAALTHEAVVGWPERKAALLQGHKVVHSEPLEEIELNINGL